jgi:hypothetical protein
MSLQRLPAYIVYMELSLIIPVCIGREDFLYCRQAQRVPTCLPDEITMGESNYER